VYTQLPVGTERLGGRTRVRNGTGLKMAVPCDHAQMTHIQPTLVVARHNPGCWVLGNRGCLKGPGGIRVCGWVVCVCVCVGGGGGGVDVTKQ
jgi:hypothetical protein